MSDKYQYQQINLAGDVTNDVASLDLMTSPGSVTYVNIERAVISVYKAAAGGIVRLQDTNGNNIFTVSASAVGVFSMNWGDEGLQKGPNVGIQAITAESTGTEQAYASVAISGHKTFKAA